MSRTKAQQRGIDFESHVANVLGLNLQPGSGNKFFAKNDCTGHGLSISCKSTSYKIFSKLLKYWLQESIDDAQGTGNIPALSIEDKLDGEQLVIMRLTDFAKALNGGTTSIPEYYKSKGIKKRSEADVPVMLRD